MFADIQAGNTYLNPVCFQTKLHRFVALTKAVVEPNQGKLAALLSPQYSAKVEVDGLLGNYYQPLAKKIERCAHVEQAVYAIYPNLSRVQWLCRESICKEPLGRMPEVQRVTDGVGHTPSSVTAEWGERKQELFEIRLKQRASG